MEGLYPFANMALTAALTGWDFRHRRVLTLFWAISAYFSVLVLVDWISSPVDYPVGYVALTMEADTILRAAEFMFWCNAFFALGEAMAFFLMEPRPRLLFFELDRDDASVRFQTRVAAVLFLAGCALYVPQIYHFSYVDYVTASEASWKGFIFLCSMPLIALLLMQKRYLWALAPMGVNVLLVVVIKVRSFLLFSVIPALLILLFQGSRADRRLVRLWRYAGLAMMALALGLLGTFIIYQRTGEWLLPEALLPRGMYLVFEQIDSGFPRTGMQTLELTVKSLLYPVYNRFTVAEYTLPEDPAIYLAELVTGRSGWLEGYRHFPLLWYSDAYVSMGALGIFQGLIWGSLLGWWEAGMRRHMLAWSLFLPFFVWVIYILCRGAPGHAFYVVARNLYIVLILLIISGSGFVRSRGKRKAPTVTEIA